MLKCLTQTWTKTGNVKLFLGLETFIGEKFTCSESNSWSENSLYTKARFNSPLIQISTAFFTFPQNPQTGSKEPAISQCQKHNQGVSIHAGRCSHVLPLAAEPSWAKTGKWIITTIEHLSAVTNNQNNPFSFLKRFYHQKSDWGVFNQRKSEEEQCLMYAYCSISLLLLPIWSSFEIRQISCQLNPSTIRDFSLPHLPLNPLHNDLSSTQKQPFSSLKFELTPALSPPVCPLQCLAEFSSFQVFPFVG